MPGPTELTSEAYDLVMRLDDSTLVGLMLVIDPDTGLPIYETPSIPDAIPNQKSGQDDWSFGIGHQDIEDDNTESLLQVASLTNMAILQHRHAYLAPRVEALLTGGTFAADFFLVTSGDKLFAFAATKVYQWNTGTTAWDLKDTFPASISGQPVEFNGNIFVPFSSEQEEVTNGTFAADTNWVKGNSEWSIGSGVATKTATTAGDLEQSVSLTASATYTLTYTLTRSAGGLTPKVGGTSGTLREAAGVFTDNIVAGSGALLEFSADASFAGTVDNVTLKLAQTPYEYTEDYFVTAGVPSTLDDPAATGFAVYHDSNNVPILVKHGGTNELKTSSDGRNGGSEWTAATKIGNTSAGINWVQPMGGSARIDNLITFKDDGRYSFDRDGNVADENPDFRSAQFDALGFGAFVWRNHNTIYPIRNRLVRWNPFGDSDQETIFPPENAYGTSLNVGQPTFGTGDENYVYIAIKNISGDYRLMRGRPTGFRSGSEASRQEVWAWDWGIDLGSNVCDVLQIVPATVNGTSNPWLLFRRGSEVRHIILPRAGLVAIQDSNCRFADEGTILCPWMDGGDVSREKAYKLLRVEGRSISATTTITPSFATSIVTELEDTTFTALPTLTTDTTSFELFVPASTTGRNIATKFTFHRAAGTPGSTPIMRGYTWSAFFHGEKTQARNFAITADDHQVMHNEGEDDQTGAFIRSQIRAAWRQTQPVRIFTPERDLADMHILSMASRVVTIQSTNEQPRFQTIIEIQGIDATDKVGEAAIYNTGVLYNDLHTYGRTV